MKVLIVNYVYSLALRSPADLLEAYFSLPTWTQGLTHAGAGVEVFQRFHKDEELVIDSIAYHFLRDRLLARLRGYHIPRRFHDAITVAAEAAEARGESSILHVNGLVFPLQILALSRQLPATTAIAALHHAERPFTGLKACLQAWGLNHVDGFLFTSRELAEPWLRGGIIDSAGKVFEVAGAFTPFTHQQREVARERTGIEGEPVLFWAGNLTANKDPLTILAGFEHVLRDYPGARLYMAYREAPLLEHVRQRIGSSERLKSAVDLLGPIPQAKMPDFFNSADIFVQGSHYEGSGFALVEALACGLVPVVPGIPAFRALLSGFNQEHFWNPGDAGDFARKLSNAMSTVSEDDPSRVREFFEANLSIPVVGASAFQAYEAILKGKTI